MRILFVNHTAKVSGAERVLLDIMQRLDPATITLLSPEGDLPREASSLGVGCDRIDELKARFTWRPDRLLGYLNSFRHIIGQIRECVRREQPELIHANTVRAGIAVSIATAGMPVKVLWHVHDVLPVHPLSSAIRLLFLISRNTHAVCVSGASANRFRGFVLASEEPRRRISVLHNGIDPSLFAPSDHYSHAEEAIGLRQSFGLSPDAFVVAIVGQLTKRKAQLELVQAFPDILERVPNAVLLIVGSPIFNRDWDYRDAIDRVIVRHNLGRKVLFTGQRRDIPRLLRAVDALIVNSVMEPFGMVLLEAMACALPVVSTNVGGVPEIIHDRRNGLLYETGEYGRLAEHLSELADDPAYRAEIGVRGHETVTSRFTIDIQIPQLKSVYRRMVAPHPSLAPAPSIAVKEEL